MNRIAIDPGASGGIVVQWDSGIINAYKMPETDTDIVSLFLSIKGTIPGEAFSVTMEKVGGFIGTHDVPKQMLCPHCRQYITYVEKQAEPASRMFDFGDGNGFLRACCLMAGFRYETVAPRTWQAAVGLCKPRGIVKTAWKNQLKDKAQKLYPSVKVTLSTADALLILEYSKRIVPTYKPAPKRLTRR